MVGAYSASSLPTSLTTTTATTKLLKPRILSSNSTSLPPKKLTKRKNHLRPKILKTLPKPLILPQPEPLPTNHVLPIVSPPENDTAFDHPTVKSGKIIPVVEEFEETQFSATEGVAATEYGAVSGNISAKSILQIGLGLVVVFVLQTICSVWIMGGASSDEKKKNLNVLDKNTNVVNNGKFSVNNDVGYLDRFEVKYRINEIREMAREARKMEAKETKNVEDEDDIVDENVNSKSRIGIGKEISARLVKVEKKLGSRNGKLPGSYLNNLDKTEDNEDADEKLVFKKKFKFRSPSSMSSGSDVKGFGSDYRNVNEKKMSGLVRASDDSTKTKSGTVDEDALITNLNGSQNDMERSEKMQGEMAREARKMEAKETKNVEDEDDIVDENVNSKSRIGIGKEISARLVKVEKKLGSRNGKLPGSYLNNLDKTEDNEEAKEADEKLVFKKKFKFRSPSSMSLRSDVKGFGSDYRNMNEKKMSGLVCASDDSTKTKSGTVDEDALITNINGSQNDMERSEEMQGEMEIGNTATRFGTVQGSKQGRSSIEVTKSRQSTDLGMHNLQNFTEESQEITLKSDRDAVMARNNGSKHSVLGNKSDIKSDLWWLKLPYVLAVLMRRGPEHEEAGFFTLRSTSSQAQDQSQIPYTVAFENHGDANNFCHLLESYFEDLGDFYADIVPLPVKELHDAVKSCTNKVIVVKKGQLKLYAGQPFADVETALHSLIK